MYVKPGHIKKGPQPQGVQSHHRAPWCIAASCGVVHVCMDSKAEHPSDRADDCERHLGHWRVLDIHWDTLVFDHVCIGGTRRGMFQACTFDLEAK